MPGGCTSSITRSSSGEVASLVEALPLSRTAVSVEALISLNLIVSTVESADHLRVFLGEGVVVEPSGPISFSMVSKTMSQTTTDNQITKCLVISSRLKELSGFSPKEDQSRYPAYTPRHSPPKETRHKFDHAI